MASVSQYRGNLTAVQATLSQPRFGTYLSAKSGVHTDAMDLYEWNAKVGCALFFPMHICEVAIRNAASEAIEKIFGPNWPYSDAFQRTLPSPGGSAFNPRRELKRVAAKHPGAPGKVIADLKFAFWEAIFTQRFEIQIWYRHISSVLPNAPTILGSSSPAAVRSHVHTKLELIRKTRNRIAHHEPIFSQNLQDVFDAAMSLISLRCSSTHQWIQHSESATHLLQNPV